MSSKFEQWMDGETDDLLLHMTDTAEVPDSGRADRKKRLDELIISDESEREYREAQKQAERINKDIAAQKKYSASGA